MGFQPSSHSKPEGDAVEGQLAVIGVLADAPLHPEPVVDDPLVGAEHAIERGDFGVEVLDRGADGVKAKAVDAGDGDAVVPLVDAQEADAQGSPAMVSRTQSERRASKIEA